MSGIIPEMRFIRRPPTHRMSPPKALKKRTVDPPKTASPSGAAPAAAPTVARQLGNEQMRTVLQARQAKASDGPTHDQSADRPEVDPWSTLSAKGQARANALYLRCTDLIGRLNDAQTAHVSVLRAKWINFLAHNVLVRIANLDSDGKIDGIANVLQDYTDGILRNVAKFDAEWEAVEHHAIDEHDWLVRQKFDDATLAARQIESVYKDAKGRLDAGAMAYITDEDYADLKRTLDKRTHISTGVLQGSRIRAHEVHDLLEVVRELRLDGQDPEKYAPGWRKSVDDELDNLDQLAKRTPSTAGTDFAAEFIRLRDDLRRQRDAVLQKRPLGERVAERIASVPIAGAKATVGAVEAIVGPFVEAAREIVDEVQIGLYYVSGGRYMPKFTSDLMKAFEQGATRTDVLKGLVSGLVGTPKRLLDAVEDGDWEAVGREAVNLYLLTKVIKETPQAIRRVPEFLVGSTSVTGSQSAHVAAAAQVAAADARAAEAPLRTNDATGAPAG